MQTVMINSLAVSYRWIFVSNSVPTLVFSNSLGTDFRIWDSVVEQLAGRYNILLYDKRGHGLSDAGPHPVQMTDFISDLEGLMEHHKVKSAILCGLSIGGIISLGLTARRPDLVSALILCNTAPKVGTTETWAERIAQVSAGGIASISDMVLSRWFTPEFRSDGNALYAVARNMLLRQSHSDYMATCAAIGATDFRSLAGTIKVPTLCVAGDQDLATPPELVAEMAAMIPGSQFQMIHGCGHIPCIEKPLEMATIIAEFVTTAGSQES